MRSEFEKALKLHKDSLIKDLVESGHANRMQSDLFDLEQNASDYEYYFDAAYQHQQSKVDELQAQLTLCRNENKVLLSKVNGLGKRFDAINKIIKDAVDSNGNSSVEIIWDEILELEQALKGGEA